MRRDAAGWRWTKSLASTLSVLVHYVFSYESTLCFGNFLGMYMYLYIKDKILDYQRKID